METNPLLRTTEEHKEVLKKRKETYKMLKKRIKYVERKKLLQLKENKKRLQIKVSKRVPYGVKQYGSEYNRMKILQAIAKINYNDNLLNEPNTYIKKHRGDNSIRMLKKYRG